MGQSNYRLKLTAPLPFAQWARSLAGALGALAIKAIMKMQKSCDTKLAINHMDMKNIYELAFAFRTAIEKSDKKLLPITLQDFPNGACGEAALLLAKYLQENNYGRFMYILGERLNKSHAWLQQGDLIVDITGDQFDDQVTSVIVTKDFAWHSCFHGEELHIADIEAYDEHTKAMLNNAYFIIKKYLGT